MSAPTRDDDRPKLGLVLGGGGVRGLAHVGVLREIEEMGIVPHVVVGVSMGALVSATYAARTDWVGALEAVDRTRLPAFADPRDDVALARMRLLVRQARQLAPSVWTWGRQGYEEFGRATLTQLLGGVAKFEELRVPLAIIATDVETGRREVLRSGEVAGAALASGAIPGLARPVFHEGRTFIDGGFSDPAPVDVAREMGADVVIAVHVGQHHTPFEADNWAMALLRGLEISQRAFAVERLRHADLVLRPNFGERVNVLDFSAVDDVVRCGTVCTRENRGAIEALFTAEG